MRKPVVKDFYQNSKYFSFKIQESEETIHIIEKNVLKLDNLSLVFRTQK